MNTDLFVAGGELIAPGVRPDAGLVIRDGQIAEILAPGARPRAGDHIDARGKIVLPGVVDPHVHVDTPGPITKPLGPYSDAFESMSRAAVAGGITTVMPFVFASGDDPPARYVERCRDLAEQDCRTDFSFHFGIVREQDVEAIGDVAKLGVRSFKAMMDYKRQGIMVGDRLLTEAMTQVAATGGIMMVHAEDGELIDALEERARASGDVSPPSYARTRPAAAERLAVTRALALARATGCALYIVHVSSREGLEAATAERTRGQAVWIETCPHYLLLTRQQLEPDRLGPLAKIGPPLRDADDNDALWEALVGGTIDLVGSDHAPRQRADKLIGLRDIFAAPFGGPGLETLLPVLFDEFRRRHLPLTLLSRLLSEMPARVFGLYPRKGTIAVGADADLVVVDPDATWTIDPMPLQTNAKYSLWAGRQVSGRPVTTIVRGKPALLDGEITDARGWGRFLARRGGS